MAKIECITQSEIRLMGAICLNHIEHLDISIVPNEHGYAKVCAIENKKILEKIKRMDLNKPVEVFARNKVLFCGMVQNVRWYYEGMLIHLALEIDSISVLLDCKKKKKSFQNCKMTIGSIIKNVIAMEQSGEVGIYTEDKRIANPVYQFQETDWQFIRRMTAGLGSCVYPDVTNNNLSIQIGIKAETEIVTLEHDNYDYGISGEFFSEEKRYGMLDKSLFFFYKIESYEDYGIGQKVVFKNKKMNILEKRMFMKGAELIFQYKLGNEKSCFLKGYSNPVLSGMSISGKVLAAKNELLKIHLDIDEIQKEEEAYWYEWVPETGNVMYCMPQKGTRVQLYFPSEKEESAIAVSCIRENGASCSSMGNTNHKYFTNENGKQFYLKQSEIGFMNEGKEMSLIEDDGEGMKVVSSQEINIISNQKIEWNGKQIKLF